MRDVVSQCGPARLLSRACGSAWQGVWFLAVKSQSAHTSRSPTSHSSTRQIAERVE